MAEDPSPPPAVPTDAGRRGGRRRVQVVDLAVARRVRLRRLELGLTLRQAAELLGVSYRQLQKYETGHNRLSAGRLHRIAEALGVEVGHFFADVDPEGLLGGAGPDEAGRGQRRMLLELVRHAAAIRDPKHREALCRLARDLAALGAETPDDPRAEQPRRLPSG
jgi:transcriptional regulator with XRE-family HTH domain